MVNVRKKVKIFLESVMKTVFYAKRAPLNSDVGSLTLPLLTSHQCIGLPSQQNLARAELDFAEAISIRIKSEPGKMWL